MNIFENAHAAILRTSINGLNYIVSEINSWPIGWYFLVRHCRNNYWKSAQAVQPPRPSLDVTSCTASLWTRRFWVLCIAYNGSNVDLSLTTGSNIH